MPNRNRKLRIGIVGAGHIVRTRHLPALQARNDVEIVAVSNATYESAEKFCEENLPHATPISNWPDLVALPDLDIVWIGTPPYMHSAVTISALEAGKHVFCQARMSMDLQEAQEMLATARRFPELVTMLCPPPYGLRGDRLVKKLLGDNFVGTPHHIRLKSLSSPWIDPEAPAHWRQRIEISGLNVLTLGIYVEVLQRWFGDIAGVYARGKIITPLRQGYEIIVPDLLTVLCVFESGAEGVLEFSGVDAFAGGDRVEAYGDKGTLMYDFSSDKIEGGQVGDEALRQIKIPADLDQEWNVENEFIEAVKSRGKIHPSPSFDEGWRYMRVVQAVADSRERNAWVDIKR